MTNEQRINRILDIKVPIYRVDIPEKGIVKDCLQKRMIKNMQRDLIRVKLANYPHLIDELEKEIDEAERPNEYKKGEGGIVYGPTTII